RHGRGAGRGRRRGPESVEVCTLRVNLLRRTAIRARLSTRRTFVRQLLNSVRRIRGHLAGWDELAGSAGVAMNSMLEDVLAREGSAPAFEDSRVDAELEERSEERRVGKEGRGAGGEKQETEEEGV